MGELVSVIVGLELGYLVLTIEVSLKRSRQMFGIFPILGLRDNEVGPDRIRRRFLCMRRANLLPFRQAQAEDLGWSRVRTSPYSQATA